MVEVSSLCEDRLGAAGFPCSTWTRASVVQGADWLEHERAAQAEVRRQAAEQKQKQP
ncbi:hypothetical protein ACQPYH_25325 [Kribbella sp. CA-245084]|uniref:hypothetical protein n=1 Tax=Kribbella sp. CA-245084 TaxID=3239940 RepID=UPI003D94927C